MRVAIYQTENYAVIHELTPIHYLPHQLSVHMMYGKSCAKEPLMDADNTDDRYSFGAMALRPLALDGKGFRNDDHYFCWWVRTAEEASALFEILVEAMNGAESNLAEHNNQQEKALRRAQELWDSYQREQYEKAQTAYPESLKEHLWTIEKAEAEEERKKQEEDLPF